MVCLLLKHLKYVTNIFAGLIFECEVKNKYIDIFLYKPSFIFKPIFFKSVGAAAGYDACRFNEALYVIHHDEVLSKFVEWNNMNTIP